MENPRPHRKTLLRHAQKGVALITALLVVAVASIVAAGMLSSQHISIQRTGGLVASDQAWWFAAAMERYAAGVLREDTKQQNTNIDERNELWAFPVVSPLDVGGISGNISDVQGLFNVNSLVGNSAADAQVRFSDLMVLAGIDQVTATALAQAATDWIDADIQELFPDGAEDSYYLSQDPPYRAGNTLMVSPAELLLVKGFRERNSAGERNYDLVAKFLSALPDPNAPLNVNTAPAEVLAAQHVLIDSTLAIDLAREDLTGQNSSGSNSNSSPLAALAALGGNAAGNFKAPFEDVADFISQIPVGQNQTAPPAQLFSVNSSYFLVESNASVGNSGVALYSLLQRDQDGESKLLGRSRGRWQ